MLAALNGVSPGRRYPGRVRQPLDIATKPVTQPTFAPAQRRVDQGRSTMGRMISVS